MERYLEWVRKAAAQLRPTSAHLERTCRCNARCHICFQDRDTRTGELSVAEWCAVAADLFQMARKGFFPSRLLPM